MEKKEMEGGDEGAGEALRCITEKVQSLDGELQPLSGQIVTAAQDVATQVQQCIHQHQHIVAGAREKLSVLSAEVAVREESLTAASERREAAMREEADSKAREAAALEQRRDAEGARVDGLHKELKHYQAKMDRLKDKEKKETEHKRMKVYMYDVITKMRWGNEFLMTPQQLQDKHIEAIRGWGAFEKGQQVSSSTSSSSAGASGTLVSVLPSLSSTLPELALIKLPAHLSEREMSDRIWDVVCDKNIPQSFKTNT
ncbi:unnamed protein product [Vitrella brassicaformis CCMP3155]|uniref:Uncharacterized protein n=1 Tax=Vitrella brassicaformis (strain CCMP3155) TaxID=1169540 RepID=A0A0G4EMR5_VITBC|nr:unnamed protein product [Vitrella brassicaformis CCMP3155]|eukprot:CEL98307.1 unnamed protein product [Vitrella brassicaformis CCMP3155]